MTHECAKPSAKGTSSLAAYSTAGLLYSTWALGLVLFTRRMYLFIYSGVLRGTAVSTTPGTAVSTTLSYDCSTAVCS